MKKDGPHDVCKAMGADGHTISPILAMIAGLDYFWIGNFANHIFEDSVRIAEKTVLHLIAVHVVTILNVIVLVLDLIAYTETKLSLFAGAIVIRALCLPVLVMFHPLVGFVFHTPDSVLQWVFRGATILAGTLTVVTLIGAVAVPNILKTFRFESLPSLPADWTTDPMDPANLAICTNRYEGLSMIELLGLTFGGYDVNRNEAVFRQQMDFFFGANSTDRIEYEVVELEPDVPMLIYDISGTKVFAFRGFASGPELSVQVERLASLWVVPYFLEELPLYDKINERYLSSSTASAHLFGWHWFSPRSASDHLLQKASAIYDERAIPADVPVLFVGVNSGGTIAKRLALLKDRRGISFLSPQVDLDEFDNRYDPYDNATQWITSVINRDGLFAGEDPGFAENFALIGDASVIGKDNVYESFCNLAELCGHHAQFGEYCKAAIGEEQLATIRAYLGQSGGLDSQ
jgi:hypothetical protein